LVVVLAEATGHKLHSSETDCFSVRDSERKTKLPLINSPAAGIDPSRTAFFLDFDGTLAPIVDDPARAALPLATRATLSKLNQVCSGALAIVSGRSIQDLDRFLQPLVLPLAGVHGLERRGADGQVRRVEIDSETQQDLTRTAQNFVAHHVGVLAETKPGSIAVHYRRRPDLEAECLSFAQSCARTYPALHLLHGKMVIEMKLDTRTKGDAIADFMSEPPFRGRTPFFAGDDVTDEAGFARVAAMEGITVKIGEGQTSARYRLEDTASLAALLEAIVH
jgi:trehalose 6-phosphate phosphatase